MDGKANTSLQVWIALGLCYLLVKLVWVGAGYLHPGAITHGAVPAVVMTGFGLWFMRNRPRGAVWLVILPLATLIVTPPFMLWKMGAGAWLAQGRASVLAVYEVMALVQAWIGWRIRQSLRQAAADRKL
ncbi:MAG: hypothetical protein CSA74_09685 [Rhodobacterales bacterium]|nr:MAG: hypothetical protein CSA74_09685 [Rhodobacterales bacterium]